MYEFASGLINVWEKRLLSLNDQERMLNAPDRPSAFLVLFDTDLGELTTNETDIERILEQDLARLKGQLARLLEDDLLVTFLFLLYDAWNLKIIMKRRYLGGADARVRPLDCGSVHFGQLERYVSEVIDDGQSKEIITKAISNLVGRARGFLANKPIDSAVIEEAVDRAYLGVRFDLARQRGRFLRDFVGWEIDVANVKNMIKNAGQIDFVTGGNLKPQDVKRLYASETSGTANIKRFLELLDLSVLVEKFVKVKADIYLEQGLQSFLSSQAIRREKESGFGLEKVVAFFYRKLNSHFNIRVILSAKDNNWSPEEINYLLLPL